MQRKDSNDEASKRTKVTIDNLGDTRFVIGRECTGPSVHLLPENSRVCSDLRLREQNLITRLKSEGPKNCDDTLNRFLKESEIHGMCLFKNYTNVIVDGQNREFTYQRRKGWVEAAKCNNEAQDMMTAKSDVYRAFGINNKR